MWLQFFPSSWEAPNNLYARSPDFHRETHVTTKQGLRSLIPSKLKHKVKLSEIPQGKLRSIFVPVPPPATTNMATAPRSCCRASLKATYAFVLEIH